jgi:hypothetical protein
MISLNITIEDDSIEIIYNDSFTIRVTKEDDDLFTYNNLSKITDESERRYIRKTCEGLLKFYLSQ